MVASLGVAGVGAFATFAAVAEYRAYLIALTILALAVSYLLTYHKKWQQGWFKLPHYVVIRDEIILWSTTVIVVLLLFFPQVQAWMLAQTTAPTQVFEGRGVVVSVQPEQSTITLRHEPIAGLMPAMTMEFDVRSPQLLEGITPGITVDFSVRPEGTNYVIEAIRPSSGG
ncbi:MAG: copper-binding protein [Candidatus Entotheonellia bacterium]